MKKAFGATLATLKLVANRFDEVGHRRILASLKELTSLKLPGNKSLLSYFDVLLFLCAHPKNDKVLSAVENELGRITLFLKKSKKTGISPFANSGLPFTTIATRYSHDCARWLLAHPACQIEITGFENPLLQLNDVLRLTLPSVEVSETTAGLNNTELLNALKVPKGRQLQFLLDQLGTLDSQPYIKDLLFDHLDLFIKITPRNKSFSRSYNRLNSTSIFFHESLQKKFDHKTLLERAVPAPIAMTAAARAHVVNTIKTSMALTDRETDPTTFMDQDSLRLYELDRGITIALYGMVPPRQLPLESYVGFTLFKNGFPASYGGGWVFGERSHFGINIFESFRGGESGFMMCQLLRVYRQTFGIRHFEVEPYQYGQDNPEGIQSGAFWFYYRYGFRPLDKKLLTIANQENKKITEKLGYRTPGKILRKFTESNIVLRLGKTTHTSVPDITLKVTRMIHLHYSDNRTRAEADCISKFRKKSGVVENFTGPDQQVLKDVALWAEAFQIKKTEQLNLLAQMIKIKPADLYQYQQLLLQFFHKEQV